MPDRLSAWYEKMLESGDLRADPAQQNIVHAFQSLMNKLDHEAPVQKTSLWQRIKGNTGTAAHDHVKGLYIYGGVGRGKTMIMDQALSMMDRTDKKRCHFNDFMLDVHARLKVIRAAAKNSKDDVDFLGDVATGIAQDTHILAFDEFQVRDIADAMIMSRLFSALFEKGVVIMATSNVAPDDLYAGGLQRSRFLPFIDVLKKHVDVIHMDSPNDYRLSTDSNGGEQDAVPDDLYLTPAGSITAKKLEAAFLRYVNDAVKTYGLPLQKREWVIDRAVPNDACMISFASCCEQPRAAEDYIALAEMFPVIFLHDVPKMGYDRRNEAKRFILLIDTLYDKGCRLMVSAEAEPDKLYFGSHHSFEFERTISRLQEMRRGSLVKA